MRATGENKTVRVSGRWVRKSLKCFELCQVDSEHRWKGFSGSNMMRLAFHFPYSFTWARRRWECARVFLLARQPAGGTCAPWSPHRMGWRWWRQERADPALPFPVWGSAQPPGSQPPHSTPSSSRILGKSPTRTCADGSLPVTFLFASLWLQSHCPFLNIWCNFCFKIFFAPLQVHLGSHKCLIDSITWSNALFFQLLDLLILKRTHRKICLIFTHQFYLLKWNNLRY